MDHFVATLTAPIRWFDGLTAHVQDRLVGFMLAAPTGTVLVIARILTPDPSGMGTHRQLGLGGCALLTATGIPCPMCGMTTTFSHLAHLHLIQGVLNQPFGLVLFTGTLTTFAVGLADLIRPRGLWRRSLAWVDQREGWIAGGLMAGLVLGWIYKIAISTAFLSSLP